MFEKFSNLDIDSAGRGGEYVVQVCPNLGSQNCILTVLQAGFGWTNGVLLWVASKYGQVLAAPQCPSLLDGVVVGDATTSGDNGQNSAGSLRVPVVAATFVVSAFIALLH